MHQESLDYVQSALARYKGDPASSTVIDIGSYDVNGSLRPLFNERLFHYTGLDVRPGPNVDCVAKDDQVIPFNDNVWDIVVTANALHNMRRPWVTICEMARVLRPGGLLIVTTIWSHGLNQHPQDYFRATDQGLMILFDDTKCLNHYRTTIDDKGNTFGSAIKK